MVNQKEDLNPENRWKLGLYSLLYSLTRFKRGLNKSKISRYIK